MPKLTVFQKRSRLMAPGLIKKLEQRNHQAFYVDSLEEAKEKLLSLLDIEKTIAWGGSESLVALNIIDTLRKDYQVIDRDQAKTPEERTELMRQSLLADIYLASANALSTDGILVHIDGVGNRVAAISFGPGEVILVVGMNKVVETAEDAVRRARNYAAPMNTARLETAGTGCAINGICGDCLTDNCICSFILQTRNSRVKNRIKVILVGEPLGY